MKRKPFTRFIYCLALWMLSVMSCLAQTAHETQLAYTLIQPYRTTSLKELSDTSQFLITDAYADKISACILVYAQQKYQGKPVFNALVTLAFKQGKLVSKTGSFYLIPPSGKGRVAALTMKLTATEAVKRATICLKASTLGKSGKSGGEPVVRFGELAIPKSDRSVQPEWVATKTGSLRLAWRVRLEAANSLARYLVHVDAQTGSALSTIDLIKHCKFDTPSRSEGRSLAGALDLPGLLPVEPTLARVTLPVIPQRQQAQLVSIIPPVIADATYQVVEFPAQSPLHPGGMPRLVKNPWERAGVGNPATTYGWHYDGVTAYDSLKGNNTQAFFLDSSTEAKTSLASATAYPNLSFTTPFDFNQLPTTTRNMKAGLGNLFYWANINHDVWYQYGFDEVSGNMQVDNLNRGGVGLDAIKVSKVTDYFNGGDTSTPADGEAPEMAISVVKPSTLPLDNKVEKIISIQSPVSIQGLYKGREYDFLYDQANLLIHTGPISGSVTYYSDLGNSTHTACTPPTNASALRGAIALLDYTGDCTDRVILHQAQAAGATAVLLIWPVNGPPGLLQGAIADLKIPVVIISQQTGALLRQTLRSTPVRLSLLNTAAYYDGALQNDVITHEYGHIIASRLSGGPAISTCLDANKEALYEGYSDFFAMMLTTDWANVKPTDGRLPYYVAGYAYRGDIKVGIRPYPFSTDMVLNPRTYADVATADSYTTVQGTAYTIGAPYISAMWDMVWGLSQREGVNKNLYDATAKGGNSTGLKLVMMGLKLMPCGPGLIDGRDGILRADSILYNGLYSDTIWTAFARRGMGLHASQGSADSLGDEHIAFDTPLFLTNFAVTRQAGKAQLAWNAQGNFQSYSFVIEKSTDSLHFTPLTSLTASATQSAYTYADSVSGSSLPFYRINYTNDLGQIRYSAIVRLPSLLPFGGLCLETESASSSRRVYTDNRASGGQYSSCFGNSGEYIIYSVSVPTEGSYLLRLQCASAENPTAGVQINSGALLELYVGNTGGAFVERNLTVSLNAGLNQIRIQGSSGGCFAQDKLCVDNPVPTSDLCQEAESASSSRTVYTDNRASGGQYRSCFGNSGEYITYSMSVPTEGNYRLRLQCASVETPTAGVQINSGALQELYVGDTGGAFVERNLTVSLKAGLNQIRIQGGSGGCFAQDKLCVEPSLVAARQAAAYPSGQELTGLQLTIFPNPSPGQFKVRFWAAQDQPVRLRLVDLRGHTVVDRSLTGEGRYQEIPLDVPAGAGSFVILHLQAGSYSEHQKVLLIR